MSLVSVNPWVVTEDENPSDTCEGDSGGAHIVTIGGTQYLGAITHAGVGTCGTGGDTAYRVDTAEVQSFINKPFTALP
jgi:secreted trypsin-like serine protease